MIKLSTLRSELGMIEGNAGEDILPRLKNAVVALWESRTNRLWTHRSGRSKEFRVTHPLSDRRLYLDLYPVTAITSVQEKFAPQMNLGSWTSGDASALYETVDAENYHVNSVTGSVERFNGSWKGLVLVTWDGGYQEDTAPADIIEGLILQAKFMRTRWDESKIAVTSQAFESGSTNYITGDVHPMFKRLARSYAKRTL